VISLNDRRKVDNYVNEINMYLKSIKKNIENITEQVRGGIELLEARRSQADGQKAEAFAIFFPAMGAGLLTLLLTLMKLMWKHIHPRRYKRLSMALAGKLYRDHLGRWRIKYGGDTLQSLVKLSRSKLWWREFTEQFMGELKKPVWPIFGALVGAIVWLVWLYLP
jgi:hypothetical protein